MTLGHFIFTFLAGALFMACVLTGPTPTGLLLFFAFCVNGLVLVWWTYECERRERASP